MASRAVTPPSSPRRWSGSRARTCLRCGSRQAPTRSPLLSRRPTTSWLRPPPTVTCPLHLLLRRRELRRIPIPRTPVNKGKKKARGFHISPGLRDYLLTAAALEERCPTDWWLDFASAHHPYRWAADHPAGCRLRSRSSLARS